MSLFSRSLTLATQRLALFAPATTRACLLPVVDRVSNRRDVHITSSEARTTLRQSFAEKASIDKLPSSEIPLPKADIHSEWRHPLLGFTADEASQFVYIHLPRVATEDDVRALLARAELRTAQILMHYNLETAQPEGLCYIRIADKDHVDAAVAALSRFTLLGSSLRPKKLGFMSVSPAYVHGLYAGWLPSSTSDLTSRVVRPPMTAPPKLIAPLLNEQWVVFKNLKLPDPDPRLSRFHAREAVWFDAARNFYTLYYKFDVVGITAPKQKPGQGWTCKILFGNRTQARKAAKLWREFHEMTPRQTTKIHRGGSDIHRKLLEFRQLLPKDTPEEEISELLEMMYRELRSAATDAERLQRLKYPTPESAVGVKEDGPQQ